VSREPRVTDHFLDGHDVGARELHRRFLQSALGARRLDRHDRVVEVVGIDFGRE
jgi:hypothetical protein